MLLALKCLTTSLVTTSHFQYIIYSIDCTAVGWNKKGSAYIIRSTLLLGRRMKKIIEVRRCGLIRADGGREIFFHMSGLQGTDILDLKEEDRVEFDIEKNPCGSRAVNIRRASG